MTDLARLLLNWEAEWPLSEVVGANGDYDLSHDTNTNVVIQQQVDAKLTVRRSIEVDQWYNVAAIVSTIYPIQHQAPTQVRRTSQSYPSLYFIIPIKTLREIVARSHCIFGWWEHLLTWNRRALDRQDVHSLHFPTGTWRRREGSWWFTAYDMVWCCPRVSRWPGFGGGLSRGIVVDGAVNHQNWDIFLTASCSSAHKGFAADALEVNKIYQSFLGEWSQIWQSYEPLPPWVASNPTDHHDPCPDI